MPLSTLFRQKVSHLVAFCFLDELHVYKCVDKSAVLGVFLGEYLAVLPYPAEKSSLVVGDKQLHALGGLGEVLHYTFKEFIKACVLLGAYHNSVVVLKDSIRVRCGVSLVHDVYLGYALTAQLIQKTCRYLSLFLYLRRGKVLHIEYDIRSRRFFKCGLERLYQIMWQTPDKSDRVNEHDASAVGELYGTGGDIKCSKELVFGENACIGESVQQRGLAHICVADDSSTEHTVFFAA